MKRTVFVAGATGAIGCRLCLLLMADGWRVIGSTRSTEKANALRTVGVEPVVVDVFDETALSDALVSASPESVVHQLTDLPPGLDPGRMVEATPRNARIREIGTRNLIAAAVAAGAKRFIAQSVSFAYAPGATPYKEDSPLNVNAPDRAGVSARGVASLESQVLAAPLEGIVLRYGRLYGPGTGFEAPSSGGPLHVDAAADAARRALTRGVRGIYNIAEDDGTVGSAKAIADLDWSPAFRIGHCSSG